MKMSQRNWCVILAVFALIVLGVNLSSERTGSGVSWRGEYSTRAILSSIIDYNKQYNCDSQNTMPLEVAYDCKELIPGREYIMSLDVYEKGDEGLEYLGYVTKRITPLDRSGTEYVAINVPAEKKEYKVNTRIIY